MTKQKFLEYCLDTYGTSPDYPFDEDFETAVLRHADNRKWYAIVMRVSRSKFGMDSDEVIDVVNLKSPTEVRLIRRIRWCIPSVPHEQASLDLGASSRCARGYCTIPRKREF